MDGMTPKQPKLARNAMGPENMPAQQPEDERKNAARFADQLHENRVNGLIEALGMIADGETDDPRSFALAALIAFSGAS